VDARRGCEKAEREQLRARLGDLCVWLLKFLVFIICVKVVLVDEVGDGGLERDGGDAQQLRHHLAVLSDGADEELCANFRGGGGVKT
jgi:hypothetical protein